MDKCRFCESDSLVSCSGFAGRGHNRISVSLEYCADCGRDQAVGDSEYEEEMSRREQNHKLPEDMR